MLKRLLLAGCALAIAATGQASASKDADSLRAIAHVPQHLTLVYDLYRNGQKLGQVTDTLRRSGKHYTLVSETRAAGPLKMLWPGNIRLESRGEVTHQGLLPAQFEHARSDAPHKLATARFDWQQREIVYQYKGETRHVDGLRDGAQDQLSQLYQLMFMPDVPADYRVQVVSRRDLRDYHFQESDGGSIQTPLGSLATRQYQRITQNPDDKGVTVWIAPERNNLLLQIRVVEDGVTLEQRLVSASVDE
jgi:hypothetical protein